MLDKAFSIEINNMKTNCIECNWSGKYIDYKTHYMVHEITICPHCKITFSNDHDQLKTHLDGNFEQQSMACLNNLIGCINNDLNFVHYNDLIHKNINMLKMIAYS